MSLRLKTIIGVAAIEAVLLLLLVSMTLDYLRETNFEGIVKRASTTATLFATTTKDAVLSYDLASLDAFVNEVLKNPDLVYARVLGPDQQLFAAAGLSNALSADFVADHTVDFVDDGIFDAYALIEEGGVVYGRVELGLDINLLRQTIAEAERRSALVAALEMGLVALFSFILGTYLTRQLQELRKGAQKISAGELNISIPVKGKDEIAEVAQAFNTMASDLDDAGKRRDQYEAELKELNRSLEDRVKQRTEQLVEKNNELLQANEAIKKTQAKLVRSEKMASVGLLAAGVAHEINNPLGFVMSNLCTLEEYVKNYRSLIEAYEQLLTLKGGEERSAQETKIEQLIEDYDLEFMNEDLDGLLRDMQEGSVRVKEIVKGLNAFSHVDSAEEMQLADINECIETTLKVANNDIKYRCEIVKDLGQIPLIYCNPGQIKQVILNILLNAAHAIKEQGRIEISSDCDDETIEISIRDNGCGISSDEIDRLFEPFFTTKEVGQGTGLGLSISYGIIVDDHHGDIRVESEPGEGSCFTIVLPINALQPAQETLKGSSVAQIKENI